MWATTFRRFAPPPECSVAAWLYPCPFYQKAIYHSGMMSTLTDTLFCSPLIPSTIAVLLFSLLLQETLCPSMFRTKFWCERERVALEAVLNYLPVWQSPNSTACTIWAASDYFVKLVDASCSHGYKGMGASWNSHVAWDVCSIGLQSHCFWN